MDAAAACRKISSLEELLAPVEPALFFRDYFGSKPLHIPGSPERFSYLLNWQALNRLLSSMHGGPNFRLVRAGKDIPPERYLVRHRSWLSQVALLDLGALSRELTDGATITINAFEQMHEPVSDLCRVLELALSNYVDVVAFAGWHSSQAFRTHWDHEDVFILQTVGKKHWRLFPNERPHPTVADLQVKFNPTSQTPYWEGDLVAGDLLYIPSGWWHDVTSVAGETIHVSFGCEFPTGLDLAQQIVARLSRYESLRTTLPRYKSNAEQREYMVLFRQAVQEITQELKLEDFFRDADAKAPARGRLSLPWSAAPQSQAPPLPADAWIHWLPPRSASLTRSDDELCLEALGRTLKFSAAAAPVLQDLMSCRRTQVHALCARFPNTTIDQFIVHLATSGLVAIATDSSI